MNEPPKIQAAPLEVPEFKSTIPSHLLEKLSDSERYMIETMSKLENQSDYLIRIVVQGSRERLTMEARIAAIEDCKQRLGAMEPKVDDLAAKVDDLAAKVQKLWDWHLMFSGKWVVIWAIGLIVVPITLKLLLDFAIKHFP